jgi:hypothetical protein
MSQSHFLTNDSFLNVSRGIVKNSSVRNIFGYNPLIGTTFIPAWELAQAYVYPTAPLNMTVTSNAADAGAVIRIIGLDGNFNIIAENVTLTSSGTATTTLKFYRINDVITVAKPTTGSAGCPANDVTISSGSTTYAKIRGGEGKNQASIFTVPAGHSFYLYRIDAFCATAAQNNRQIFFRNFVNNVNGVTFRVAETSFLETMNIQRRFPFKYEETTDLQFQLRASAGTQYISVFGEGVLVKE